MSTRPPTARGVALVVATAVSLAASGSALAQVGARGSCAAMAGGNGCARGSLVASCCCVDAHPGTPADRQVPAGGMPFFSPALDGGGWPPVTVSVPDLARVAPTHGYRSVSLHTFLSTFLI